MHPAHRVQLGTRDTEIASIVENEDMNSIMAGDAYKVCKFAHALRMEIFRVALGVEVGDDAALQDPVADATWHRLLQTANDNTDIYMRVFGKMPDNTLTLDEYQRTVIEMSENTSALDQLKQVRGMLVNFALDFLKNEDMEVPTFSKEKIVPRVVFL
jgi:hypothetical protein